MKKITWFTALASAAISCSALAGKAPKFTPDLVKKGKEVYTNNGCNACHGDNGDGKGAAAAALNPAPRDFTKGDFKKGNKTENIFDSITKGLPPSAMAGYAHIPEKDRWALVAFIQSLGPKKK